MIEQWICERVRTVKAATWVAAKTLSSPPNLLGEVGASDHETKELTAVKTSIANRDYIRSLEDLGMSPSFRYKSGNDLFFESWITPDGITETSVLLEDGTSKFLDEVAENDDELRAIFEEQLKRETSLSFETWFEDGVILVSMKGDLSLELENVIRTKTGLTDAQTFQIHRQVVEKRSVLHKALRVEDRDDALAKNFYFVRYRRGVTDTLTSIVVRKLFKFLHKF